MAKAKKRRAIAAARLPRRRTATAMN